MTLLFLPQPTEPSDLALFGLKKSSLDPSLVGFQVLHSSDRSDGHSRLSLQDLEIHHGSREQVVTTRQGGQGDTLVTLEEVGGGCRSNWLLTILDNFVPP